MRDARHELDDLLRVISHDLRAPVRHLGAFSQLLRERLDELGGDPESRDYLQSMDEATRNLGRMIDGLQQLSMIGRAPLERQPLDLHALAHEVRQRIAPGTPHRDIDWNIATDFPPCEADPLLVRQLLERLLSNAVKFTGRTPAAQIVVDWQRSDGGTVEVRVRDNGAGFPPTGADRLFGIFERLHPVSEFEGLGVGLAAARYIVERHGGSIRAEGAPHAGCSVWFSLGG
jgi:two-component system OmpR family sensor kinase